MHLRRVASFVLGAWIVGSLLLGYIAVENAGTADRLLSAPPRDMNRMVQTLGPDKTRMLLQYESAEQNRYYLDVWERVQLILGPVLVVLLIFATRVNRLAVALGGAMIVFAAFSHFVLSPEINYIDRSLDFTLAAKDGNRRLWALEFAYTGLEILKLAIGCVLAGYLFIFRTRRVRAGSQLTPAESAPTARLVDN